MQRDIRFVADNPAIVFLRRDIEDRSLCEVHHPAVIEDSGGVAGEHNSQVLHSATAGADTRADVHRPLPAGLVCRPPKGLAGDGDQFQPALLELADIVGQLETLGDRVHSDAIVPHDQRNLRDGSGLFRMFRHVPEMHAGLVTFSQPERRNSMTDIQEGFRRQGLVRPRDGRILAGVCAGLGRRFGVEPWAARLLFVLILLVIPGSQLLIYPVLWILMPNEEIDSTPEFAAPIATTS
jgi:phage shock protein C